VSGGLFVVMRSPALFRGHQHGGDRPRADPRPQGTQINGYPPSGGGPPPTSSRPPGLPPSSLVRSPGTAGIRRPQAQPPRTATASRRRRHRPPPKPGVVGGPDSRRSGSPVWPWSWLLRGPISRPESGDVVRSQCSCGSSPLRKFPASGDASRCPKW
jgi:hypothetical protein